MPRGRSTAAAGALLLTVSLVPAAAPPGGSPEASAAERETAPVALPSYKMVKLGVLAGDEYAMPFGINADGDVVGYSGGQTMFPVPFVFTDRSGIKPLRLPGGSTSGMAQDINDDGYATGHIVHTPAHEEAAMWRPSRKVRLLGSLGTPVEDASFGLGINADRAVAGWSYIEEAVFEGQEAFRSTVTDGMESVTPGARPGFGYDLNASGDVSGEYEFDAFRTDGDEIIDISSGLAGITTGEAINADGQVAITQQRANENDAWRWSPGTGLTDLGLAATDARVFAHGINSAGDVVGRGRPVDSPDVAGGYLFRDGLGAVDLTSLLVRKYRHWYISEAWDINDSGQIVAEALDLRTGEKVGVRLDPKP